MSKIFSIIYLSLGVVGSGFALYFLQNSKTDSKNLKKEEELLEEENFEEVGSGAGPIEEFKEESDSYFKEDF